MAQASAFIADLVNREIDRIVAEAAMKRQTLSASDCAADVLKIYPRCGFAPERIANGIMMAAAKAGVAVELGQPYEEPDGRGRLAIL